MSFIGIQSMTGFSSRTFAFKGQQFKIELKSLNHRFLEIKFRLPRELNAAEPMLRPLLEGKIKRGSIEIWVEKQSAAGANSEIQLNMTQALRAYGLLSQLKNEFNLDTGISLRDITGFPDVLGKATGVWLQEGEWSEFLGALVTEFNHARDELVKMRQMEGEKLRQALLVIIRQMRETSQRLNEQREVIRQRSKDKIKKKIELCFEAYPTADAQMRALMESRLAQEIAISLDRLDIEEELTRYAGHIEQLEKLLSVPLDSAANAPLGKKLDFLLQELNREVNTLGNKSQDLEMSQEVIQLKLWVEQLREQCMNLE